MSLNMLYLSYEMWPLNLSGKSERLSEVFTVPSDEVFDQAPP